MEILEIKRQLADEIAESSGWIEKLNNSNPNHYGIEAWDIKITWDSIWVDIPNTTFTFKNAIFEFDARLGSSNDEDGIIKSVKKKAVGSGKFRFENKNSITITNMILDFDLDLME